MSADFTVVSTGLGLTPELITAEGDKLRLGTPIMIETLASSATGYGYQSIDEGPGGSWVARASLTLEEGTVLEIHDEYRIDGAARFHMQREAHVVAQGTSVGVRIAFDAVTDSAGAAATEWQFFVPSPLGNRKDGGGAGGEGSLRAHRPGLRDRK